MKAIALGLLFYAALSGTIYGIEFGKCRLVEPADMSIKQATRCGAWFPQVSEEERDDYAHCANTDCTIFVEDW